MDTRDAAAGVHGPSAQGEARAFVAEMEARLA